MDSNDEILRCSLCTSYLFQAQAKSLACLHSFCDSCFQKTFSADEEHFEQDTNFACPVCHINHAEMSGTTETESLQLSGFVEKLLHARQIQESHHICEVCSDDEDAGTISAYWCQDCMKFLCEKCEVWHQKLRPHDHVVKLADDESQKLNNFISPSKCTSHNKKFKMYCPHCGVCMCSTCLLEHCSGEKACSWAVSVESMAPDARVEGQLIMEKMASLAGNIRQQNEEMKNRIGERLNLCSERKEEIWKHAEEVICRLKENTNALMSDLEVQTTKEIETIQEHIQLKENHFKQLEILSSNIQQLLSLADNVDMLLHFPKLKSKWLMLESLHVENIQCQSRVIMEYNTWYIKMFQMLKDYSVGNCRLENIENTSSYVVPLGESLHMKCTEDFVSQYPPSKLRLVDSGCELVEKMERMITSVFVTEDDHVLVSDFFGKDLREYDQNQTLLYSFKPEELESPLDMCFFSDNVLGVVAGNRELFLMKRNKEQPSMTLIKHLQTEKKYTSLCNCYGKILALDKFTNVDILSLDGTVVKKVLSSPRKWSCNHRISCGPNPDTFLLLDFVAEKIHCYNLKGTTQFTYTMNLGKETSDVCTDENGNIFVCSREELYTINANNFKKHVLFEFDRKLSQWPRMFVRNEKLYISLFTDEKNCVKIFSIS